MNSGRWEIRGLSPLASTVAILVAGVLINFFYRLYKQRRMMTGLPMPPFHPLFGHLITMGDFIPTVPPDIHPHTFPHFLRQKYSIEGPVVYLDNWPAAYPICFIVDPEVAYQATQLHSLPKHEINRQFVDPVAGVDNMLTMEGSQWKKWRGIFNPGFASGHLISLVPGIIENTIIFCKTLTEHARLGDIFSLEEEATKLTVDVIGRVVLDTALNAQTSKNELISAFRSQVRWVPVADRINPFKTYNPIRQLAHWYYKRIMNNYLGKVLDERFAARQAAQRSQTTKRSRSIVDLALDTYLEEGKLNEGERIDPTFKRFVTDQIKLFMFAGHDTTSSTIAYIYHLLSKNPHILQAVREEYDQVLGSDISQAPKILAENPHLLSKLPYSQAIIKETLRLFPPVSSARAGKPGFFLEHNGTKYPTDGFMLVIATHAIHRRADLWDSPTQFYPERWLTPHGAPVQTIKGAWRPFEHGPRNCIGQELAMMEIKIIMALTLRSFDVTSAYDELDKASPSKGTRDGEGAIRNPVNCAEGERAYQILLGSAKPVGGMPARVKVR